MDTTVAPGQPDSQICAKIMQALSGRMSELPEEFRKDSQHGKLKALAHEIASEFTLQLENPRQQLRSLLWNLRDLRNPDFVRDVMGRVILPRQLPMLASEEMASAAKRAQRAALQEQSLRESTLRRGQSGMMDRNAR